MKMRFFLSLRILPLALALALAVACTKALLHGQIVNIMERSVVSALTTWCAIGRSGRSG